MARKTSAARPPIRFGVHRDSHGNAHQLADAVLGTIIPRPATGSPLDLLGLTRLQMVIDGRLVTVNWNGRGEVGDTVLVYPHVINGRVFSATPA